MRCSFVTSRAPRVGCIAITKLARKPRVRRAKSKSHRSVSNFTRRQSLSQGVPVSWPSDRRVHWHEEAEHVQLWGCLYGLGNGSTRMTLRMIGWE